MKAQAQSAAKVAVAIMVLSLTAAAFSLLVPIVSTVPNPAATHSRLAVTIFLAAEFIGAALWMLISAKVFKVELRRAYLLIVIGMIVFSATLLQLPIAGVFDAWESFYITSGIFAIPSMFATIFMYAGMRRFARLLNISTSILSFKRVVILSALITAISFVAAHYLERSNLEAVDVYIAVVAWSASYVGFATFLAMKVNRSIGDHYKNASARLRDALLMITLAGIHEAITSFFVNEGDAFVEYGIFLWPMVLAGLFLVRASHSFAALVKPSYAVSDSEDVTDESYIETVAQLATLASDPSAIDPILDGLRSVTASLAPGQQLTDNQKQKLLKVCDRLVNYLTTDDPLRSYKKEDLLTQNMQPAFRRVFETT